MAPRLLSTSFLLILSCYARAQTFTTIPGVSINYYNHISSSKAYCESILTGCPGGFSSTSCIQSWCPPQPSTTGFNPYNTTTTWACDQVCCPFIFTSSGTVDYGAASGCLLNEGPFSTSSLPSSSFGRTPGAVLGSDPNFSACMTLSINTEVCSTVGNWCTCWNGPNQYWGATCKQLATSCASFFGSFYGKTSLVSSYLSLGGNFPCYYSPNPAAWFAHLSSTSSSSSTSVSLWPGFVTAPPAPPQHPLKTTASPVSTAALAAPTSTASSVRTICVAPAIKSLIPMLLILMIWHCLGF